MYDLTPVRFSLKAALMAFSQLYNVVKSLFLTDSIDKAKCYIKCYINGKNGTKKVLSEKNKSAAKEAFVDFELKVIFKVIRTLKDRMTLLCCIIPLRNLMLLRFILIYFSHAFIWSKTTLLWNIITIKNCFLF